MKRKANRILEHILGPLGSILLHLLVILVLVKLIFFETGGQQAGVEVIIVEPERADLDELKQELKELEEVQAVDAISLPDLSLEVDVALEDVEEFKLTDLEDDFADLDVMDDVRSPLVLRGLYQGRSAGGRSGALRRHAGRWGQRTEAAVLDALEWLKKNQNPDGSWDTSSRAAMTGLGLLTFLAHGETPTSEDYGLTVEMAIRWLTEQQAEDGSWDDTGLNHVYGQAIAAYAVSEAYALTQIPALKTAMDRAARVLVNGQQSGGGWDYYYRQTNRRDTSVAAWHVQALKAAVIAGADVPEIKPALERAARDLKSAQVASGRFGYSINPGDGTVGMTGAGVLCLQLLGHGNDDACERGIAYLNDRTIPVDWDDSSAEYDLYGWYYITQAKFHHGRNWDDWNDRFAPAFTRAQNDDGSWSPPGREARRGKVYGTTFAALTLQVYYRLLPTYQPTAVEVERAQDAEDEDVLIDVI